MPCIGNMAIYSANALPLALIMVIAVFMCRLQALQAQSTVFDPALFPVEAGSTESDRPCGSPPEQAHQAIGNTLNQQGESHDASIAGGLDEQPCNGSHQAEQLEDSESGAVRSSTPADATGRNRYQHQEQLQADPQADVEERLPDHEQEGATAMVDGHGVNPETSSSSSSSINAAASSRGSADLWAGPEPAPTASRAHKLHLSEVDSIAHQQAGATGTQSDNSAANSNEAGPDGSQALDGSAGTATAVSAAAEDAGPLSSEADASSTSSSGAADSTGPAADTSVADIDASAGSTVDGTMISTQDTAAIDAQEADPGVTDVAIATAEAELANVRHLVVAAGADQQQQEGDFKSLAEMRPAAQQSGVLTATEHVAQGSAYKAHDAHALGDADTLDEMPGHAAVGAADTSSQQEQQQTEQGQAQPNQAPQSGGEKQANTGAGDIDLLDHDQWLSDLTNSISQVGSEGMSGLAAAQQHPEGVKQDSELEGQQEGTATVDVQKPAELQVDRTVEGLEEQQQQQQQQQQEAQKEQSHGESAQHQLEAQLQEVEAAEGAQLQQDMERQADQQQQQQQKEETMVGDLGATEEGSKPQQPAVAQQGMYSAPGGLQDEPMGLADVVQGLEPEADHNPANVRHAAVADGASEAAETEGSISAPADSQQVPASPATESAAADPAATSGAIASPAQAADGPIGEAQLLAGGPDADSLAGVAADTAAAVAAAGAAQSLEAARAGDANAEAMQLNSDGSLVHNVPRHKSVLHTLLVAALMMMLAGVVMLVVYGNSNAHAAVGSQKIGADSWLGNSGLWHLAAGFGRSRKGPMLPVSSSVNTPLLVLDYCTGTEGEQKARIKRESSTPSVPDCSQGWGSSRDGEAAAGQRGSYARAARNSSKHDF